MRVLVLFLAMLLAFAAPALAERRVALVIGNDSYPNLGPGDQLHKAVNDAEAVGDTLEGLGFEVIRGRNLDHGAMLDRLDLLSARLAAGDMAFVFYAGHGVAIDGANYLLPSDIPPDGSERRIKRSAIPEAEIIQTLRERGVRVGVVVLDACRNNPFAGPGTRAIGGTRGLTRPQEEPKGIFGIYSAGIGQTALDRLGPQDANANSVFTCALLPVLKTPGMSLIDVAYRVSESVEEQARTVGHEQTPGYYDQARGRDIYLAGKAGGPETMPAASSTPSTVAGTCTEAKVHFDVAREIGTAEAYQAFLEANGVCPPYAGYAKALIAKLATGEITPREAAASKPNAQGIESESQTDVVAECNRLAADPRDLALPEGLIGVSNDKIETSSVEACQKAVEVEPSNPRLAAQLGRSLASVGRAADAFRWYYKAAELGHAHAQFIVGYSYDTGNGVESSVEQAMAWYHKAAEQGHLNAQTLLAFKYANGEGVEEDDEQAFEWNRKAAEQGNPIAQFNLGLMYFRGEGVPINNIAAVSWFQKAADQSLSEAQFFLGATYEHGRGVEQNFAMALNWYRKAADQGHSGAQTNVGALYANGNGVAQSDEEAII